MVDVADHVGGGFGMARVQDPAQLLIILHEAVGLVDEKRWPHIFDITKQRGRGDVARKLGARRQEVQQDENTGLTATLRRRQHQHSVAPFSFFCRRLHFSFGYAKHTFSTWLGPGNTALLGMEIVANSPSDRRQVGQQKHPQRSWVMNASKMLYRRSFCVGAPMQGHPRGAHLGSRW
jgi:hypothetical protein